MCASLERVCPPCEPLMTTTQTSAQDAPGGPDGGAFVPCQFMRSKTKQVCVIRLGSTGTIMEIELLDPLDVTRACLVCATKPVDATVMLGEWEDGMHRKCGLRISWPRAEAGGVDGIYPPPARYAKRIPSRADRAPDLRRRKTNADI